MAPGRKRGAKGVKTKSELSLGDLVLAKISRPEDFERTPDPKKYFVQFFGTSEIAFVAPADIQAFTSEAKSKVSARCQGKTHRYFVQAVKDICEEFEELQHKNSSSIRDDNNTQTLASEAQSLDPVLDGALEVDGKDGIDKDGPNSRLHAIGPSDVGSGFERCSKRPDELECQDMKPCSSSDRNRNLSPQRLLGKRNKLSTNPCNKVKESVSAFSPSHHSLLKEEGSHDIKVEGRYCDEGQNELTNGHKLKLAMGPTKNLEGARRNSGLAVSHELTGGRMLKKIPSGDSMKVSSADNSRSGLDVGSERKGKKFLKERKHSEAADDGQVDTELNFDEHNKVISRKKMKAQHGREKQSFQTNEGKISKCVDTGDDASKLRAQTSKKNDCRSPNVHDDKVTNIELKRSSVGKMENRRPLGVQISTSDSNHFTDEDDLPPTKRHRRALDAMSSSALISENRLGSSAPRKNDFIPINKCRSPVVQLPTKRRAVRLCADDDDELPKTPIHGGFTSKVSVIPRVIDSKKKPIMHGGSCVNDQSVNSGPLDDGINEKVQSVRVSNVASSPAALQGMDRRTSELSAAHVSSSPLQLDSEKLSSVEATPVLVSPKRSTQSITGIRPSAEPQNKHSSKTPGNISQKKAPTGANRGLATASDRSTSFLNQLLSERSKPASSGEKRKTTPKSDSRIDDSVLVVRNQNENITALGERLDVGKEDKTNFPIESKIPDSVMSMKHLIAAAQARKKQSHIQNSYGNPFPLLVPDGDMPGRSPSPNPATLAFESSNMLQLDVQGLHPTSPASDVQQLSSFNQHENEELEERRVSSGHQATGSSLSGGTEAAVARDSFEGMIETLSRTKESIGRATRLAIDCAKYGIANEVVELLIQKLENEPNFHRRVDLFFLVDSITQCSHSQRGIAGASYIPTVQAALPRLLGAAAPPGAGAQENRRQCRKVLRLWLERKILPESVLRRYMDDIMVANDDSAAGVSLRRPSRAERSIDDPIREMEGMVVDEYGSNATFQLPGLLSSHVFEEDEEYEDNFRTNIYTEVVDTSPSKHTPAASRDPENYTVTPSDRRHCILEDVDGELEMEDVSGHQKEERLLFKNGIFDLVSLEPNSNGILEAASNKSSELLSSPEGSPPLPPGSPPVTPPLPTSPPPTLSSPPPPPSSLHPFPPPPVGPPPTPIGPPLPPAGPSVLLSQQSFPPQPPLMSLHIPPLPSALSSSPRSVYQQPPLPHEIGNTTAPTGSQPTYVVSSTRLSQFDASVRSEVLKQQPSCFPPSAVSSAREHAGHNSSRPLEYGPGDAYLNPQASQHRQFLPGSAPFPQRPLRPELPPQRPPSHFSYPNSVQQHQYPPYSLPNFSDCSRRYANDDQLRVQVNEFNADGSRGGWMGGGRSCSGPPYPHEGYFGPPAERPPASVVNYQASAPNTMSAPSPIPVHSVPMMPCRPDMSAVNWRPT
ncbi:hypothetical protein BUALT_Bualt17G0004800 [Buddleja alternifolia]|uniref:CID domain-containing protein n=1 Tax=Buddleja alternifolia TaxID=168488 RepID=A0AAV6W6N8_9LAMI|nr:hypothetical protein BUALT_Bualt17G0004800 [Buddleja alternifolia]